jgi:thiol-disulfide isomerase/thioredoxin
LGLGSRQPTSVKLVGKDIVERVATWHVLVQWTLHNGGPWHLNSWMDVANPSRVVKQESNGHLVFSKYDPAKPGDPIPTEVMAVNFYGPERNRLEVRFLRRNTHYDVRVDSATWTLAGLNMPVGTTVSDYRISRQIGYWDGSGLSENPPPAKPQVRASQNSPPSEPAQLLAMAEKDTKSPFALAAATWILLNTPDGPEVEKAIDMLLREHLRSTNLVDLCEGLERVRHRSANKLLQAVLDTNPRADIQARACFTLATLLKSQANESADEPTAAEAGRLFDRVITDFGQVDLKDRLGRPLAEAAKGELTELRRLGVGREAPEIEGEDLAGRKIKLSDHRGKVVVLTFWGTWCGPCMRMVPQERKLVERLAGKPFALLGVNADTDEAKVKAAEAKEKITWRSFRDGESGPIAAAWNVHSWPTIYVLDAKGVIRYRNLRDAALDAAVDALLKETPR